MAVVLGVDPGACGAICWLSANGPKIVDMPLLNFARGTKNRREIDYVEVARLIQGGPGVSVVVVERVASSPQMGVASSFAFGRAAGLVIGVAATLRVPLFEVVPHKWQRFVGLPRKGGKDAARFLCKQLWPESAELWARVKDDGRADAALLAEYGRRNILPTLARDAAE